MKQPLGERPKFPRPGRLRSVVAVEIACAVRAFQHLPSVPLPAELAVRAALANFNKAQALEHPGFENRQTRHRFKQRSTASR